MVETYMGRIRTGYRVYFQGEKNIAADALSRLTNNGNQDTTHESTHKTETILELFDIE